MKRYLTLFLCLVLIIGAFSGCKKKPQATESQPAVTATPEATAVPSKVFMIEDFNNMADPVSGMKPLDLSAFKIEIPAMSTSEEEAEEGKALKVELNSNCWCQAFQFDDNTRISAFTANAKNEYYLRVYVSNPSEIDVAFTIALSNGSKTSFLDSNLAVLTDKDGNAAEIDTGNATSDAGDGSSLTVPTGFTGWMAWPLSDAALKPWAAQQRLSDLAAVNYIKIDVRPMSPKEGDYYILDNFCISDQPSAVAAKPGTTATPAPTDAQPTEFATKNEELAYMITQYMNETPQVQFCPEYDPAGFPNIKAIWFTGAKFGTKDTKVFAYIGFPASASADNKVPAVVLQHGGGGYAYPTWIDKWNKLGYAAIAVCNTGYFPAKQGITDFYGNASWTHTIPSEVRKSDPRVLPPNNDGMGTSKSALNRQWMYHAIAQTAIANNILRNDERVDKDKVGITGISWGGVITSIAIGYDTRFAFAVPVYGSAYLYESLAWMKNNFTSPGTKDLWNPSLTLKNAVNMPILWLGWTNDSCFSINSQDKSFADTPKGVLTLLMNMGHGHLEGWIPEEIYRFANSVVKGTQPLTTCATQPEKSKNISFTINKPSDATNITAKAYYLTEKMTYSSSGWQQIPNQTSMDQKWSSVACTVNETTVTATLPDNAYSFYVEITTTAGGKNYVTCSRYIVLK